MIDQGLWRGVLYLIVVPPRAEALAFGIEIACDLYFGVDEMIYSISDHGTVAGRYDGGVYIKEADDSALLRTWVANDPFRRRPRHFSFVGGDNCYEVLGSEPVISTFENSEDAYVWGPAR